MFIHVPTLKPDSVRLRTPNNLGGQHPKRGPWGGAHYAETVPLPRPHPAPGHPAALVDLDLPAPRVEFTDTELARAARFTHPLHADRYLRVRAHARGLIAARFGHPLDSVTLDRLPCPACGDTSHGPPIARIRDRVVRLSLARSGSTAAILITGSTAGAVDIEWRIPAGAETAVEATLTESEREWLSHTSDRREGLTRLWTRKEAVLKAIGVGLWLDASTIDTIDSGNPERARSTSPGWESEWRLTSTQHGALHITVAEPWRH